MYLKGYIMKTKIIICLSLICFIILTGCQKATKVDAATIPQPTLNPDAANVCLFFDDAWMNQYEVALPVLLEYGYPSTFGVITDHIGKGHDICEYMGEEEIRELADYGMEIACHTSTHLRLTDNLTDEQLQAEIIDTKLYLEEMGFEIETFVYPFYAWDDRMIAYVKEAGYHYARGGWQTTNSFHLPLSDEDFRYHLPACQITDQDIATFISYLDGLGAGDVICLVYHFVADDNPETTSTPITNFHEQMAYLKEAGFNVVLPSDLFE